MSTPSCGIWNYQAWGAHERALMLTRGRWISVENNNQRTAVTQASQQRRDQDQQLETAVCFSRHLCVLVVFDAFGPPEYRVEKTYVTAFVLMRTEIHVPMLFTFERKFCRAQPSSTTCLLYTSPSPRDATLSRMPSSA